MQIISHRGYWISPQEKNQAIAFERSFQAGFGTETDVRDSGGRLVISHDPPLGGELDFDSFCAIYNRYRVADLGLPLALNIKADGLAAALYNSLAEHDITNYFVFDMSIPDMMSYIKKQLRTYTRLSDFEPTPLLFEQAIGLWIDGFDKDWNSVDAIEKYLLQEKQVCLVSSELHGRPHLPFWSSLQKLSFLQDKSLMLCTDFPSEAKHFFDENDK